MFKSLVAIVIGSLMVMSAESLRVEAPIRILPIYLDDLSPDSHYIGVKTTLTQGKIVLISGGTILGELSRKDVFYVA